jgi:hypothetical protein
MGTFCAHSKPFRRALLVCRVRSSGTKASYFSEDGIGISSPGEGFGILVVVSEIVTDGRLELANTSEGAAPNSTFGQQAKEAFELV